MTETYARFTGVGGGFDTLVYEKKKLILRASLASEPNVLAAALNRLAERDRYSRDFTLGLLTDALREVIACFPVYRTYVSEATTTLDAHDRVAIERAVRLARRRNPTMDASVYDFLRAILTLETPPPDAPDRARWREFVLKFQQLTGPVMAKGLEDTAFYVYNRLVSLNEVGGEPEHYGLTVEAFHRANAERQRRWPFSMTATSTHDTKRSEDVRARITVLSELPEAWAATLARCAEAAVPHRVELDGQPAPDPNEEYLFYQTVLGSLPFELLTGEAHARYVDRLVAYMRKATKEAKVNTSWIDANPDYDAALEAFVRASLAEGSALYAALGDLARVVAFHGMWASLAQATLKFMSPGVPDTYQGTEVWDFSLVDPDNRRPVDYALRAAMLEALRARRREGVALARELVATATDGRIKMLVTHVALNTRRMLPELFGARVAYAPLAAVGARAEHVVAFARRAGGREVVVVVPRLTARLAGGRLEAPVGEVWHGTSVPVAPGTFANLFTGEVLDAADRKGTGALALERVFAHFPVGILERTAGGVQG
jgi:(1->4)-alpha-D-glucan 1-alpha-D-glucosylmutase